MLGESTKVNTGLHPGIRCWAGQTQHWADPNNPCSSPAPVDGAPGPTLVETSGLNGLGRYPDQYYLWLAAGHRAASPPEQQEAQAIGALPYPTLCWSRWAVGSGCDLLLLLVATVLITTFLPQLQAKQHRKSNCLSEETKVKYMTRCCRDLGLLPAPNSTSGWYTCDPGHTPAATGIQATTSGLWAGISPSCSHCHRRADAP